MTTTSPCAAASQPPVAAGADRWWRRPVPRWLPPIFSWLGVALVLCLLLRALCFFYAPAYFYGIDEGGYLVPAKGLALHGNPAKHTLDSPVEFVGENMVEARPGVFYGKYPIGYPLLCAVAHRLGGPAAPFLVNPAMALLGVVGIYLLGQALIGRLAGFLAAFLLGLHPIYLYYGLRPMSHAAATCCGIWGMYFLCRWLKRRRLPSAFLAGAVTAFAGAVRSAEVLLLLASLTLAAWVVVESWRAAALDWGAAGTRRAVREAGALGVGIAAGLAPLLLYQWLAFGAPWITGYSFCDESSAFSWAWFRAHLLPALRCLSQPTYGLGYLLPLGFLGIGCLLIRRPKHGWILLLWGVPLLVVYVAYYCGPAGDGGLHGLNQILYVRFFLTLYPAFILGALALAYALPRLRGLTTAIVTFALLVFPLLHLRDAAVFQWPKNGWASHGREIAARAQTQPMYHWLVQLQREQQLAVAVGPMVREHAPDGAVLVADWWFVYYLDYVGDYHLYYPSYFLDHSYWDFNWLGNQLASLRNPGPYPLQRRRVEELQAVLGGKSEAERLAILAERLRRHLEQGRRVFLLAERQNAPQWSSRLGDAFRLATVAGLPDSAWSLFSIETATTVARVNNPREVVASGPGYRVDDGIALIGTDAAGPPMPRMWPARWISAAPMRLVVAEDPEGTSIPLAGFWRFQVEHNFGLIGMSESMGHGQPNSPYMLFENMIRPLLPVGIAGAIWYQGESNADKPVEYRQLLRDLIEDWRFHFGAGDFPFGIVQLTSWLPPQTFQPDSSWARLREAQQEALELPGTGLAVILDAGDAADIHPKDKRTVGHRLAQWALAKVYGRAVVPGGPIYRGHRVEGGGLRILFDQAGDGLALRDGDMVRTLVIAGPDGVFQPAQAAIEGGSLLVWHPDITAPRAVRYAWADNPEGANLINTAGFPAGPFRTDR